MAESEIQAALASQHRVSIIAVVRHSKHLSMQEIVDQLEADDKAFVLSQPLEVFIGKGDTAAAAVTEEVVAAPRKRAQAAKRGRKATAAPAPKKGKKSKKAPPRPAAAANGKTNGHAKATPASSADELVTKFIGKLGKGGEFKMGDLLKASGDKISRVTLINALNKLGSKVERQGSGRGTSYVVA